MSFIIGSFADDSQCVLAGVQWLAVVSIERGTNLRVSTTELRTAALTDGESGIPLDDPQFAFRHENSLAPKGCANEMAPVPGIQIRSAQLIRIRIRRSFVAGCGAGAEWK